MKVGMDAMCQIKTGSVLPVLALPQFTGHLLPR
jgi:hypothetical protein